MQAHADAKMNGAPPLPFWERMKLFRRESGRLFRLLRPEAKAFTVAVSLLVLATVASLVLPLGIRRLLDTALQSRDAPLIDRLALLLLALYAFRAALSASGGYLLRVAGERIVRD